MDKMIVFSLIGVCQLFSVHWRSYLFVSNRASTVIYAKH